MCIVQRQKNIPIPKIKNPTNVNASIISSLFIFSNFQQSKAIYLLYANIFYIINIFLYIVNVKKTIKYKPIQLEGGFWLVNYDFEGTELGRTFWTKEQAERFIKKVK